MMEGQNPQQHLLNGGFPNPPGQVLNTSFTNIGIYHQNIETLVGKTQTASEWV